MSNIQRVLVYVNPEIDGSPAIRRGADLALRRGAALTILGVVSDPPWHARIPLISDNAGFTDGLRKAVHEDLELHAVALRAQGIAVDVKVETGRAFLRIVEEVVAGQHDIVVKTAERPVTGGRIFGSTAMHLMRKAPCPVWAVYPDEPPRYGTVLVAINPDPDAEESLGLVRRLLNLGVEFARADGARLHVLHVWGVPYEGMLRRRATEGELLEAWRSAREGAQSGVDAATAAFAADLEPDRIHIEEGDPQARIPEIAHALDADLLVMGTVGRSGISGLFMGNVAEQVLSNVQCTVLTAKPDGFVSPIRRDA
jgi:universal stress protein E